MVIILHWQHAPAGGQESDEAGEQEAKNAREIVSGGAEGLQSKRAKKPKRPEKSRFGSVCGCVGAFGLPLYLLLCWAPPSVLASVLRDGLCRSLHWHAALIARVQNKS